MTATAVLPTTSAPVAPRAVATTGPRDPSAGTQSFDLQLHAARQQQAPSRGLADTSSRKSAPAPSSESAGASANKASQGAKGGSVNDSSPAASADAGGTAVTPPDATSSLTSPVSATAATAGNEQADPGRDDATEGDQDNSVLAGNMLALLGMSAGVAFGAAPAKGGDAWSSAGDHAGKAVAVDLGASTLLQADGVDGAVATPTNASASLIGSDAKQPALGKAADATVDLTSALAMSAPPTTAAPAVAHALQLQPPAGSQAFSHELGQQVIWLSGQDIKQARIRLHPDDLGQLDVKISVTHDRVDVVFSAQHPAAVTAVQQSLSQLGQMLTQQGLSLGHAEVGQQDRGQSQGQAGPASVDTAMDDVDDVHGGGVRTSVSSVGLLDAFA